VTTVSSPFKLGQASLLLEPNSAGKQSVGIVVTGSLLYEALQAGKELNESGISASVLHMPTIKPLDERALLRLAEENDLIITVEEHQIIGGLGGAVAEYLSEARPTRVKRLGVHDQFGQSGEPEELIAHYGMDKRAIVETVKSFFAKEKLKVL
jgi:transketolase